MVGTDLLVRRVARPEIEAALDEAVLAAAGEDAAEPVRVLHVVRVEKAASILGTGLGKQSITRLFMPSSPNLCVEHFAEPFS